MPALVLDVIDGDTVRVRAQLGWHVELMTLVRIDGIDAPSAKTPAGSVARDYLAGLLPVGTQVTLVSRKLLGSLEKYGRVLGDLLVDRGADAPLDVAAEMVASEHAKPWKGRGPKPE